MMSLKGKAAIVTGGSSGIGEATVREMVNSGAHVLIADINDERGQQLASELHSDVTKVICQRVDVNKRRRYSDHGGECRHGVRKA